MRHVATEAGDTLVEVLLALVVIALTVVAILGAFGTSLSATTEQRTLARADAVLRSFVEAATYDISLAPASSSPGPAFVACPTTVPNAYTQIATDYNTATPSNLPSGYTVAINAVSNLSSTCSSSAPSPQLVTAKVTSTSGANDEMSFVVSQPDQTPAAISTTITSISPTFGPPVGGTSVIIVGAGFTTATQVDFGSTAAPSFHIDSDTQITAVSPAGTGTVDVTVSTPQGTSATNTSDTFTYGPTVTKISPATGPPAGGTLVTITGTGFTAATSVKFGATAAPSFTVVNASSINATSPAGVGIVDVTVTTPAGTSTTSSADLFTYGLSVTGISPSSGPDTGGTTVSVAGSGFTGATAVKFGTTAATSFTVNSPTSITAVAPAGAGEVDVTVTTPSGTSATSTADKFTYQPGPVVGLGLVIKTGTKSPAAACDSTSGTSCSASPDSQSCVMTGTKSSTTCDITGIWTGKGTASVTFYIETVDAAGNAVVYNATSALSLTVNGATTSVSPFTIPAGASTTAPDTVTALLSSHNATTSVTITGGGYTLNVQVTA